MLSQMSQVRAIVDETDYKDDRFMLSMCLLSIHYDYMYYVKSVTTREIRTFYDAQPRSHKETASTRLKKSTHASHPLLLSSLELLP